jgi:hypothetical protein
MSKGETAMGDKYARILERGMADYTEDEIDAGARALRERMQAGRITRPWAELPKWDKRKWRAHAAVVLCAALRARQATEDREGE